MFCLRSTESIHCSVDRYYKKKGPTEGIKRLHWKAHPSLQPGLDLLTLDSCYLGAVLLCPYLAEVHRHSTLWKDRVTERNKARWAYGLRQQVSRATVLILRRPRGKGSSQVHVFLRVSKKKQTWNQDFMFRQSMFTSSHVVFC